MKEKIAVLFLSLFIISLSVILVFNFNSFYYFEMKQLDIPGTSGMTESEIKENYDAVINYITDESITEFSLPALKFSKSGEIHFREVKNIFIFIKRLCVVSFALGLIFAVMLIRKKQFKFLKNTAVLSVSLPLVICFFAVLFWDKAFTLFHKLLFRNDYWIFDERTDPVIKILPDEFFMHALILIFAFIILFSGLCFLGYKVLDRKQIIDKRYFQRSAL